VYAKALRGKRAMVPFLTGGEQLIEELIFLHGHSILIAVLLFKD